MQNYSSKQNKQKKPEVKTSSRSRDMGFFVFDDDVTPGKKTFSLYKYTIIPKKEHDITHERLNCQSSNFAYRTTYAYRFNIWG